MSAHSLLIQCAGEIIRAEIAFSVRAGFRSRKERNNNRPAGVIRLKKGSEVKAGGRTNWDKSQAACVAVAFPPFNFGDGQALIVIAASSVSLQQTQPGGQCSVVSPIKAAPKSNAHLLYASRGSRCSVPGYLLR